MAPALRHLYAAANPTRREYDGFMDVISARAAIGRKIGEEVDSRIIFPGGSYVRGLEEERRGWFDLRLRWVSLFIVWIKQRVARKKNQ